MVPEKKSKRKQKCHISWRATEFSHVLFLLLISVFSKSICSAFLLFCCGQLDKKNWLYNYIHNIQVVFPEKNPKVRNLSFVSVAFCEPFRIHLSVHSSSLDHFPKNEIHNAFAIIISMHLLLLITFSP